MMVLAIPVGFILGRLTSWCIKARRLLPAKTLSDAELPRITLNGFHSDGAFMCFRTPLVFTPTRSECGEYLEIEDPQYSMLAYAKDIPSLQRELEEDFEMMWQVYVVDHEERELTPKAARLRQTLIDSTEPFP